jgi:hypothetical protein
MLNDDPENDDFFVCLKPTRCLDGAMGCEAHKKFSVFIASP